MWGVLRRLVAAFFSLVPRGPVRRYIYDARHFSISSAAPPEKTKNKTNAPKIHGCDNGDNYIFFSPPASLYSSPRLWNPPLSRRERESRATRCTLSPSLAAAVGTSVHSLDVFFFPESEHACVHTYIHGDPLILPPVLLSISAGSGAGEADGCWQGLDCGGKDGGSGSRRDRIAVSGDPLEGVIRLLWNLPPIRSKGEDIARCSAEYTSVDSLLPSYSSFLSTSTTFSCTHFSGESCFFFNQRSLKSPPARSWRAALIFCYFL